MQKCNLIACFFLTVFSLAAQTPKSWEAKFLNLQPELDGQLTDSCWQLLEPLGAFTSSTPIFGNSPHCQTELRLFYTETALYVAAHCYDPDQGGVRRDGGIRDGALTGDWFQISLDTWNDDQLTFDFTVSAAGVQSDQRQGAVKWDAIWQSAVQQQADGWTVEICIPFTALRYPRKTEQTWGAQFTRYDRSSGELSSWSPQDPIVKDRVIQFGTLTGIQNIRQIRRRSLAVHSETSGTNATQSYYRGAIRQTLGIDGRIGLNESTTLDFTLLPPQSIEWQFSDLGLSDFDYRLRATLPEPRQFMEEERDLFGKNPGMNYYPSVDVTELIWRNPPQTPTEFVIKYHDGNVLQASKLSARTQGNWRFGVFNALLGPTKVEYQDFSNGELRKATLQSVSDYFFTGAEYLLPNNSFIHLSNAMLLAGPGMTTATPQLAFRLRDRSNSLEIAGGSNLSYQQRQDDEFLDYRWNLSLGRINRRWGWHLSHSDETRSIIRPDNSAQRNRQAYSSALIQYRDFRPRGPFLNFSADLGAALLWYENAGEAQQVWTIHSSISALDKGFRFYSTQLNYKPYYRIFRYAQNGIHINRKVSPEIGGGFSFRTDNRKHFQLYTRVSADIGLEGEFPKLFLNLQPSWVLGRRLRLSANIISHFNFESLSLLSNTGGMWIFEQYDQQYFESKLGLNWYPADRIQLTAGIGFVKEYRSRREAVELLEDGMLQPVAWTFSEETFNPKPIYQLGLSYFFTTITQVRFNIDYTPEDITLNSSPFPPNKLGPRFNAKLSFVWFIDGAKG